LGSQAESVEKRVSPLRFALVEMTTSSLRGVKAPDFVAMTTDGLLVLKASVGMTMIGIEGAVRSG